MRSAFLPDPSVLLRIAFAGLLCIGLAAPAAGGGLLKAGRQNDPNTKEKPEFVAPAARMPIEGTDGEVWQARLHNAELEVREAQHNSEAAEWGYNRARTRRYPRGEALAALRDRRDTMRQERDAAEQVFVDLVEEARQAGVPNGTLADFMDLADEIQRLREVRANTPEP